MDIWKSTCRGTLVGKTFGSSAKNATHVVIWKSGRYVDEIKPSELETSSLCTSASQPYVSRWLANGTARRNQNEKPNTATTNHAAAIVYCLRAGAVDDSNTALSEAGPTSAVSSATFI